MTERVPPFRRRSVRLAVFLSSLVLLAASPGGRDLLGLRDTQRDIQPGRWLAENATWSAAVAGTSLPCEGGMAGPFPCSNVDLASLVTVGEIGVPTGSDVWGWTDPVTGREIAITTTLLGAAFVDVTDPTAPVVLGRLPIAEPDSGVLWRDVKVFRDHAYIVSEHAGTGMVVYDLTQLREIASDQLLLTPTTVYEEFGSAHNIAINTETGFAYAVGSNTCDAGLHMVDLNEPAAPTFAGCFADDGYTHDVQCVVYRGPDAAYRGHEICFASNEDTLTIVDVTDKSNPLMISRNEYDSAAYTHQGWLTPDQRWFLFGDELDEQSGTVGNTATYIVNVEDLDDVGEIKTFEHDTTSIDHNLYIDRGYVWEANYSAGLRILRYTEDGLREGVLEEVGFFDVFPLADVNEFAGAWTAYPFFESGTVVLSSFDSGLFVLTPTVPAITDEPAPAPVPEPEPQPDADVQGEGSDMPATGGGLALLGLGGLAGAIAARRRRS